MHLGTYRLDNPWILAPMAGVSEMPFRRLARAMGAAAAPTELVSAKGLLYGQARTARYLTHAADEQPFWVQIFGGDEESMAAAAVRAVAMGAAVLDINMGCPVRKVTRHGAGSALLCDPKRAAALVRAVATAGVPVTVKIRSGWDAESVNCIEMGQALAEAGCVAVALHARTRAQAYTGRADWHLIAEMVQALPIPVIGNGDAATAAAARRMRAETGCAAVMIGRGALGNPWIFAELAHGRRPPDPAGRWRTVQEHLAAHLTFVGDRQHGIRRFRPHLMWYAHGLVGAAAFRAQVARIDDHEALFAACERFFAHAHTPTGTGPGDGGDATPDCDLRTALG